MRAVKVQSVVDQWKLRELYGWEAREKPIQNVCPGC